MKIESHGHTLQYKAEQILLLFFPNHTNVHLVTTLTETDEIVSVTTEAEVDGKVNIHTESCPKKEAATKRDRGNLVKRSVFFALRPLSDLPAPWGILTGVRPVKLVRDYFDLGLPAERVREILQTTYLAHPEKAELALSVAKHEELYPKNPRDVVVYIGIPYCPSRCAYCSFISDTGAVATQESYIKHLVLEIERTAELIRELSLSLRAVYIGGGTPTALSAPLLRTLLSTVRNSFRMPSNLELTVEAGRPDTIDAEKLSILLEYGTTRISINPQTLHDETLRRIGRRHSAEDFFRAYSLARRAGFTDINTDLIAGLPGEDFSMFRETLDQIRSLTPESLTVHTLYLKRASYLKKEGALPQPHDAADMVSYAQKCAMEDGYVPYYMYRQKATVGNLENVGYAHPGKSCFYNTVTMTDCANIFALGAGGVSRLLLPDKVVRVFNFKHDDAYVHQFDEILRRKDEYRKLQS